jgi:predicted HicB family RNase H-like nuclease
LNNEKIKRGPGRPTDNKKDTVLRVRIDKGTHEKLEKYAGERGVSMSQLIRDAIQNIVDNRE